MRGKSNKITREQALKAFSIPDQASDLKEGVTSLDIRNAVKNKLTKIEQDAYNRLRETLGFSDAVDLSTVLSNANTRIKRLQETLNGTHKPLLEII